MSGSIHSPMAIRRAHACKLCNPYKKKCFLTILITKCFNTVPLLVRNAMFKKVPKDIISCMWIKW